MTSAQVLAYSVLIKSPERVEKLLSLMDEPRRAEVAELLAGLERLTADDLRRIWGEQRKAEEVMVLEARREKVGAQMVQQLPALAEWLAERT